MATKVGQASGSKGLEKSHEQDSSSWFLGLPRELRDKIYTMVLVDPDIFDEDDKFEEDGDSEHDILAVKKPSDTVIATPKSTTVGAILISEVKLNKFDKSWKRTSYVRPVMELDDLDKEGSGEDDSGEDEDEEELDDYERPTTSCLGSAASLSIFLVCRQIYQEASCIFYAKNLFYVEAMASLVPFLEDRPAAARELIQKLSIPVPYGNQYLCDDEPIGRCTSVSTESFAEACDYLKDDPDILPNLKQLDLRVWDYHDRARNDVPLSTENLNFNRTRLKQLASIAPPGIMTISLLDWHRLAYDASSPVSYGDMPQVIKVRLPEPVFQKVQRYRQDTDEEGGFESEDVDSEDEFHSGKFLPFSIGARQDRISMDNNEDSEYADEEPEENDDESEDGSEGY